MSTPIILVRCVNGDHINAAMVYRWFVTQNAVKGGWDVCASVHGPQNPYVVIRCDGQAEAYKAREKFLGSLAKIISPMGVPPL